MKMLKITLQGKTYEVGVEVIDDAAVPAPQAPSAAQAMSAPVLAVSTTPVMMAAPPSLASGHAVNCPMPGTVFKIYVTVGQAVTKDHELLGREAMKMESPIYAPCAGTVAAILVKAGDAVSEGQTLIQLS